MPTKHPFPKVTPTVTPSPSPRIYSDNFDDGNADGWWLGYSHHTPWVNGNWRVENGTLVQDQAGDDFIALVDNFQSTDQTIETRLKLNGPAGYGGVTFWYKDNSRVSVFVYPAAGTNGLYINEITDGVTQSYPFPYQYQENTWYTLRVKANSTTGELEVYMDNTYLFTHVVNTPNRTGQSGLNSGNSGGYFDNFTLTSR